MSSMFLTVVVPVYNEEDVLPLLVDRLRPVLDGLGRTYEVLTVDDGSTDTSAAILERLRRQWPQLRIVRLRANAGHQAAISAGLERARGEWVVTIDADLQDPPETIAEMIDAALNQHVDVVYGVRTDRSTDSPFKRHTAGLFYRLMRRISGVEAPLDAGDFRLMSRATVDAVNTLPEANRVLRLVVPTLGFPATEVGYRREHRAAGDSKYPLSKMLKLSLDSVTGFSMAPLRLATWFGIGGFVLAMALLVWAIIGKIMGDNAPGWTSSVVVVSLFAGAQLLCLGILGEYVGRVYLQQQGRPSYYIGYDSLSSELHKGTPAADTADLPLPEHVELPITQEILQDRI
ncbi:glycosyltransferase family 2 protein [Branchiibius sp. NY16-3462-2]|uniref:glycosyltransferase family 2 protein n=1 Tax=Branchiibius sp. NY16-3462-2 TaxID=1807500 RepID=UPI00079903C5|nr:glycosyltransferase family 2 protein [Branchiibius sp. NY16-3462-2]KYH43808.1 glucosyl transferase [Branchiibius sp. NY16-3462-2]